MRGPECVLAYRPCPGGHCKLSGVDIAPSGGSSQRLASVSAAEVLALCRQFLRQPGQVRTAALEREFAELLLNLVAVAEHLGIDLIAAGGHEVARRAGNGTVPTLKAVGGLRDLTQG